MLLNTDYPDNFLKGVNLGGWLVLEKWITPTLFEQTDAVDEYNFHLQESPGITTRHYQSYITENDFEYLSGVGINCVRIPVGYWLFGDYPPFPKNVDYLDSAFLWAEKHGIKIIIDLHAAPGSQNGYDHSGLTGNIGWHLNNENIQITLDIIEKISKRYCGKSNLYGIELLNEPHISIPLNILENFYTRGYGLVRKYSNVKVIISDAFRPLKMAKLFKGSKYTNLILDSHFYQAFYPGNKKITIDKIIKNTLKEWPKQIKEVQQNILIICGEWSLGIDPMSFKGLKQDQIDYYVKEFGKAQLDIFHNTKGWFFWTYKTEDSGGWNFSNLVKSGTLNP